MISVQVNITDREGEILLSPFYLVNMELLGVVRTYVRLESLIFPVRVEAGWAEVEVSLHSVHTAGLLPAVVVLVPTGLHQVDLPTGREASVDVVLRHEPDGGSDPAGQGETRPHLHAAVPETELVLTRGGR